MLLWAARDESVEKRPQVFQLVDGVSSETKEDKASEQALTLGFRAGYFRL